MLDIKQIEHRTCDVCGETCTIEESFYKDNYDWIGIEISGISYGTDWYHRLDICPSCKKEILNYLKENCNNASNWPINL